jgi:tetratricopeptide (TPR) repeat protein
MEIVTHRPGIKITPFWNKIPAFFLYGLKPIPLLLAVFLGVLLYLISNVWIVLILYAVTVKYSMAALQYTMEGELSPPPLSKRVIFQGYGLPIALFVILVVYALGAMAVAASVSPWLALLILLLGMFLFPAMIMCLCITESFTFSINPINWMALVKSIGWPYLALYGLYLAFGGAQATVEHFIPENASDAAQITVWLVINTYFTIISFHMMGYVILQYHRELHLQPSATQQEYEIHSTPLLEKFMQEGKTDAAIEELICLVNDNPDEIDLRKKLHNYAMINHADSVVAKYAPSYMRSLTQAKRYTEAAQLFIDCLNANYTCHPERPESYHPIFEILKQRGQFNEAIALTKGFHKRFPENDLTPALYFGLAKLFCEDMHRDDLAIKLLHFLVSRFKGHHKTPEVRKYLQLIKDLPSSS